MSNDEADAIMEDIRRWEDKKNRTAFMHRMERKLNRKERYGSR
jgi:hypothetical protein